MGKAKRRGAWPAHYYKNVARNAERRYRLGKMGRAEALERERQMVVDTLSEYVQMSLAEFFGVRLTLGDVVAEFNAKAAWHKGMSETNGADYAGKLLKRECEGFLPAGFWIPAVEGRRDASASASLRDAGDLTCKLWCLAIHGVLGYGRDDLAKVLRGAWALYKRDLEDDGRGMAAVEGGDADGKG